MFSTFSSSTAFDFRSDDPKSTRFQCGRFSFPSNRPLVMGILNITPDSFSDGGAHPSAYAAGKQALRMVQDGVDIIDIGGESTRPGAEPVCIEEELARVLPVIEVLREQNLNVPLSIDTYKPKVMRAALEAGVDMVNDIWGFRQIGALEVVAESNCGVCIMHMQGEPQTMQKTPAYQNPVAEVRCFLENRIRALEAAGIEYPRICIDPGFGFGKTADHNDMLLANLNNLSALGLPVLVGLSRKSFLGVREEQGMPERLAASVAAAVCALQRGARIFRVHDVGATVQALKIASRIAAAPVYPDI